MTNHLVSTADADELREAAAMQFTAGPWRCEDSKIVSAAPDEFGRAICVADLYGTMSGNAAADTSLIAAAPELYEALATILANASVIPDPAMNGSADCYRVPLNDIDAAIDLLAKARGQ